jgi:hypothetical protein
VCQACASFAPHEFDSSIGTGRLPAYVSAQGNQFIAGDSATFSYVELILADGSRFHYNRISPGQDFASAVFEDTSTPTEFYGSRIRWNGNGWTVELQNGSSYKLRACNGNSKPGQCGVVEFRNANGEVLRVVRERNGNVSRIVSPTGNGSRSLTTLRTELPAQMIVWAARFGIVTTTRADWLRCSLLMVRSSHTDTTLRTI